MYIFLTKTHYKSLYNSSPHQPVLFYQCQVSSREATGDKLSVFDMTTPAIEQITFCSNDPVTEAVTCINLNPGTIHAKPLNLQTLFDQQESAGYMQSTGTL